MRKLIHLSNITALILCPALLISLSQASFTTPSLYRPAEYQLTPPFFKFISFGFWPAAADLLWMQTLQRVGSVHYTQETLPETLGFYRLNTSLDPNFYESYDQAAVIFSFYYEAAFAALEMIDRGIKIYEHGNPPKAFWTHPYSLYLHRAYVNAFLRNDWEQAKQDYLKASFVEGSPVYLQDMKAWLQKEGSEKKLAVKVLKVLIQNTKDEDIKKKYEEKLQKFI